MSGKAKITGTESNEKVGPTASGGILPLRVRRGAAVEIRLALREHQGHEHVDIRLWWVTDDSEWLPSRRGVTVPPSLWPRFFEAIVELDHELRAAGVVDGAEAGEDG